MKLEEVRENIRKKKTLLFMLKFCSCSLPAANLSVVDNIFTHDSATNEGCVWMSGYADVGPS